MVLLVGFLLFLLLLQLLLLLLCQGLEWQLGLDLDLADGILDNAAPAIRLSLNKVIKDSTPLLADNGCFVHQDDLALLVLVHNLGGLADQKTETVNLERCSHHQQHIWRLLQVADLNLANGVAERMVLVVQDNVGSKSPCRNLSLALSNSNHVYFFVEIRVLLVLS